MIFAKERDFVLFLGDCNKELRRMPKDSVDVIFADPPYRLSNDGTTCIGGERKSVNKADWDRSEGMEVDFVFYMAWIMECRRVLKPNGTIWIIGNYHSIYYCGFALQFTGFHILNDITVYHPNPPPNLGCRCFTHAQETLLWAKKTKNAKHIFNYEMMKAWGSDKFHTQGKQMKSVWEIKRPAKWEFAFGKHVTQKSVELTDRVIMASSNEGDLVLDPFAGYSSTGVSALRSGRRFIGMDITEGDLEVSVKRLNHARR